MINILKWTGEPHQPVTEIKTAVLIEKATYHNPTIYSKRSTHAFTSMIPIAFLKNKCLQGTTSYATKTVYKRKSYSSFFFPQITWKKRRKTYLQRLWTMPKIYPSLYLRHFSSLSLGTSRWTSCTFLLCRSRTDFSSASWCLLSTWISCTLQIQFYFHSYSMRHRQQNSSIMNIIHPND